MSIRKSLAIAVSLFLMASGLDAAANPVQNLTKLLTAVRADNYESSVAVAARAEFIKLNPGQLGQILQAPEHDALFATPYGFSLIHGWMLNKFAHHDLPFYINQNFSFDKYIRNLIAAMPAAIRQNISQKWGSARGAIEENRWAYYQHMQYIPAAIAQAGTAAGTIAADVIRSAYTLALPNADLKEHMNSIIAGRIPAEVPQAQAKLHSIMTLLLSQYNIASLLPEEREIADVQKFVEFVVEHVPALYRAPGVRDVTLEQVYTGQTGEQLRIFVAHLIRVRPASAAEEEINGDIEQVVFSSVAHVRQHQATAGAADKIVVSREILPVYAAAAAAVAAGGVAGSPQKRAIRAAYEDSLSPAPHGSQYKVDWQRRSVFDLHGVHETILMERLGQTTSLVGLSYYEISDIFKFFVDYLDKFKRADTPKNIDPAQGPYMTKLGRLNISLAHVLSRWFKLLADGPRADTAEALEFINTNKSHFVKSMEKHGVIEPLSSVKKVPAGAGGAAAGRDEVVRNLFGSD
ncbi:MAG: hypothetical protein WCJ92_05855 [Alphaproteobacteria bacterium]